MRPKDLWALLKDSWNAWGTDKAPRLDATLGSTLGGVVSGQPTETT